MQLKTPWFTLTKYLRVNTILFFLLLISNFAVAQSEEPPASPDTTFAGYINDYRVDVVYTYDMINLDINVALNIDSLSLGVQYEVIQTFLNTKNLPVIIKDIAPSCTCISTDWYKQPIAPGATGWIKIKYLATIPDKKSKLVKAIIYDEKGYKPMGIQPIKISVNVKQPANN